MPAGSDLPEPLSPLSRRQALEISDTRWRYDVDRLIEAVEQVAGETASPAPPEPAPVESGPSGPVPATSGGASPGGAPAAAGGAVAPNPRWRRAKVPRRRLAQGRMPRGVLPAGRLDRPPGRAIDED